MKTVFLGFLAAGLIPLRGAPEGDSTTLYFFFSPETTGADEVARRATEYVRGRQGATLRPVLLVEDFKTARQVGEESPIIETLKGLDPANVGLDIPLYDEEGLRLAEAWHINRLPALVLVQGGHAHAVFGTRVDPKELEECK